MNNTIRTIHAKKNIALVAHDNCKSSLVEWTNIHKEILAKHNLYGTGTTSHQLNKQTGLNISGMISGPMGGDLQIGALISEQKLDMLIFFWDPLNAVPHDPDVKALLRVSAVWNIPVATNRASADLFLSSMLMNKEFDIEIPDYHSYIEERTAN